MTEPAASSKPMLKKLGMSYWTTVTFTMPGAPPRIVGTMAMNKVLAWPRMPEALEGSSSMGMGRRPTADNFTFSYRPASQ